MSWYYLNVTVHVLAALFWLRGMFFLALSPGPGLATIVSRALASGPVAGLAVTGGLVCVGRKGSRARADPTRPD